ncbi:chlorohydrolase family protein [Oceaniglobus roseus]|uniref:chlorohydrolase family protein n=1 Tax=Oceaniglobus roseus TaxID=1737570 RepID=UPI000C7EC4E9|nr:chlorohydrolase family protein [Kandeliimicrobium roseum]
MIERVKARWVLDGTDDSHRLIPDGEVLFDGDTILHVGPASDRPADRTTDCGRVLIAPGFVDLNALADVDTTILGVGAPRDGRDTAWSRAYAEGARRDVLDAAERETSVRIVFAQLLASGITTALPVTSLLFREWAESGDEFCRIAEIGQEIGLRLCLGPSFRSSVNVVEADGSFGQYSRDDLGRAGLDEAVAFIRDCRDIGPLVTGLLVPSTIDTCSDDLLHATAAAARDLGVPFRLHCCQSLREAEILWKRSGRSSIGHLADLGVLGPNALLPHAVNLGGPEARPDLVAGDIDLLAQSGAVVVHCPLVIGRGGRRLKSFGAFRARGIAIGLGTDTAPPDMLMNLQMGLAMGRVDDGDRASPAALFHAATIGAADAIGRPDLGRLAAGKRADIVAWDLSDPAVQPVFDPLEALFLMPPGRRARHVWVGGAASVTGFSPVAALPKDPAGEIERIFSKLLHSYGERNWRGLDAAAIFPPSRTPTTPTRNDTQQQRGTK